MKQIIIKVRQDLTLENRERLRKIAITRRAIDADNARR